MGLRTNLQIILENLLGSDKVYFQPPSTINMSYPCIVYELFARDTVFADNNTYLHNKRYKVTVIDRSPDSLIPEKIAAMPKCSFDRRFVTDNLYHDVFNIYY